MQTKGSDRHGFASLQFLAMFLRILRAGALYAPVFFSGFKPRAESRQVCVHRGVAGHMIGMAMGIDQAAMRFSTALLVPATIAVLEAVLARETMEPDPR